MLETYISNVVNVGRSVICVGSGNNGNDRIHTAGQLRQGQTETIEMSIGTYETKEDAFLERVETAVRDGVKESAPMAIAKNLMEMLVPFVKESVGEINLPDRTLTMEKTDGEIAEDNLDWEKEADMDAALDFADSF